MILIVAIVLHYLKLIKLQLEHTVFVSVDNTYLSDEVKMRLMSHLSKSISRVLQKLLECFNGTTISTYFLPLAFSSFTYYFLFRLK